jgi:putative tricarboxylic transport membrane protein
MNPGPTVFLYEPQLIYAVFITFFLANLLMLPLGFVAIRLSRQVLKVPHGVLVPIILLFCIVGAFAINNTAVGVVIILVLGMLAFLMEENGYPIAPSILGIVLGPMLERTFMMSMIRADGRLLAFFDRPIAATLGVVTLLVWAGVVGGWLWRAWRSRSLATA